MFIPQIGKYAESILENGSSSGRRLAKLQTIGRQAVAALCALGGFKETIKIGSEVQVGCCHVQRVNFLQCELEIFSFLACLWGFYSTGGG